MVHAYKKDGFSSVKELGVVSLLMSFSFALVASIWAVYMRSFVSSDATVGFIATAFMVLAFVAFFVFVPFMQTHKKKKIFITSVIIYIVLYVLLAFTKNFILFLILGALFSLVEVIRKDSFGVIIRNISKKKSLGKSISLIYTLANLGWLIGPLLAGLISNKFGIPFIFLLAAIFSLMALITFLFMNYKAIEILPKKVDKNLFLILTDFFKDKELYKAYLMRIGQSLWWAIIFVYIPLFIVGNNLSTLWVGGFLFVMVIPLVLTEYLFGKLSDRFGFRIFFIIGFSLLILISLAIFFVQNIYWMLGLTVLASFAMAMIEPTAEAYFFSLVNKRNLDKYYGPFNTSTYMGQVIGRLLGAIILLFLPTYFVFLGVAVVLSIVLGFAFKIR